MLSFFPALCTSKRRLLPQFLGSRITALQSSLMIILWMGRCGVVSMAFTMVKRRPYELESLCSHSSPHSAMRCYQSRMYGTGACPAKHSYISFPLSRPRRRIHSIYRSDTALMYSYLLFGYMRKRNPVGSGQWSHRYPAAWCLEPQAMIFNLDGNL